MARGGPVLCAGAVQRHAAAWPGGLTIDKIFRSPGAAWLLFVFGMTVAPPLRRLSFADFCCRPVHGRGTGLERSVSAVRPRAGSDENGDPAVVSSAMAAGSIPVQRAFALICTGSRPAMRLGPLLLLVCVSLVLWQGRLVPRSLCRERDWCMPPTILCSLPDAAWNQRLQASRQDVTENRD